MRRLNVVVSSFPGLFVFSVLVSFATGPIQYLLHDCFFHCSLLDLYAVTMLGKITYTILLLLVVKLGNLGLEWRKNVRLAKKSGLPYLIARMLPSRMVLLADLEVNYREKMMEEAR